MVVPATEVKIDHETLKGQVNLTPEQEEALTLQISQELDAEAGKKKKPDDEEIIPGQKENKEKTELSDEELLAAKDEDLTDELKAKKVTLTEAATKKETDRLLNAKDEELSEEDKPKKAELVKAKETETVKAVEKEISDYAKEHNITVEEAKADFESIAKIQEKYKSDPKQLARANLHLQRLYSKTEEEAKAFKEIKANQPVEEVTIEAVEKFMESGKITVGGKSASKEQIIEAYREANPDLTDTLDDDKVFKLAAKDYHVQVVKSIDSQKSELSIKAKEKRLAIFDSFAEADKKYIPEIKPIIEKVSDSQLMDSAFSLNPYIAYAKGKIFDETVKRFDQEKKDYGEKEYQRGLGEAKILGEKRPPGGGGGAPPKGKETSLTEEQKKRALEMFDQKEISEAQAYQLYKDYLKETNQS